MSRIPVSVCIIARDEEKHIEECLRRIQPYGFEIIVTDTGSTDKTKELAQRYADKVLDFAWIDDFSAARNFCARHASYQWILALDCDEYLTKCDIAKLLKLMKSYPEQRGCLPIKSIIIHPDKTRGCVNDIVPRFYNKKYFLFENPVHEQLVPKDSGLSGHAQSFLLPMEVIHHGYALTPEEMRIKQERNLRLLYHQLETEGETPYICFQIGQSQLVLEHLEQAIAFYERGLSYGESGSLLYVQQMVEGLAKAYVMAGRNQEALALMEQYEPECDSARYAFYYANVLMDNQEYLKALIKYVKATMMHDTDTLGDELLYCYRHIIELYHKFGEDELAEDFKKRYEQCLLHAKQQQKL